MRITFLLSEEEPKDEHDGKFSIKRATPVLTLIARRGWSEKERYWAFIAISNEPGDEGEHEFVVRMFGMVTGKELTHSKTLKHTFPRYEDAADVAYLWSSIVLHTVEEAGGRSRLELWIDGKMRTWVDVQIV